MPDSDAKTTHEIVEIKALCHDPAAVREILRGLGADFRGTDHQIDTYFHCPAGRLKLRQGNIENNLIHYHRANQPDPKNSHVLLCPVAPDSQLKAVLSAALGIRCEVDKGREIYFIGNVKFHIDAVAGLGSFVEIEAIDSDGSLGLAELLRQCRHYMSLLHIADADLIDRSYSDMVMERANLGGTV